MIFKLAKIYEKSGSAQISSNSQPITSKGNEKYKGKAYMINKINRTNRQEIYRPAISYRSEVITVINRTVKY